LRDCSWKTKRELGSENKEVDRNSSTADVSIGDASLHILLPALNMEVINISTNVMFKIKNGMSLVCKVMYEDFRNRKEKHT
jgi:hypothetical protein